MDSLPDSADIAWILSGCASFVSSSGEILERQGNGTLGSPEVAGVHEMRPAQVGRGQQRLVDVAEEHPQGLVVPDVGEQAGRAALPAPGDGVVGELRQV